MTEHELGEWRRMIEHLRWDKKNKRVRTQYGKVTHLSWCERERDRILAHAERQGGRVAEIRYRKNDTECALYVDNIVISGKDQDVEQVRSVRQENKKKQPHYTCKRCNRPITNGNRLHHDWCMGPR